VILPNNHIISKKSSLKATVQSAKTPNFMFYSTYSIALTLSYTAEYFKEL